MPSTETELKALATKTKFVSGWGYSVNTKVSDIIELLRAPAKDSWSSNDEIQHEGQSSNKRAIEERHGLAMYLSQDAVPVLEPTVVLFNESDISYKESINIEGNSVGTITISMDTDDLVAISGIQQLYALYEISQNYKDSPCYEQLMDSTITLVLVPNTDIEESNITYRYINRQFAENQMQDFLLSDLARMTNFILETEMLRSETEDELDGSKKLLVNTKSNSLANRALAITTKKCIEGIHQYLMETFPEMPLEEQLQLAEDLWFEFSQQEPIQLIKKDNKKVHQLRESGAHSLVFKPIGLTAVFRAAIDLYQEGISVVDAFERLFSINLDVKDRNVAKYFFNSKGRAFSGKDDIERASAVVYNAAATKETSL